MSERILAGWERLRHSGLLLDTPRLRQVASREQKPLSAWTERELRRLGASVLDGSGDVSAFVSYVLESACGFISTHGTWQRGSSVAPVWGRRAVTGETIKPRQLWRGFSGGTLPVFFDDEPRLGIGRGRRATSHVVQWLRAGRERLALLTNGRQWRLVFAGLDFDAWCEWDVDLWFEEGALSTQVDALRALLSPELWTPSGPEAPTPLLLAVLDSRKGQAELSAVLGERVREAVELLVQSHGEALRPLIGHVDPADIYRGAVRVAMRMVVVFFAESRDLLPRDNALYHGTYGLGGLLEELERGAARGGNRLARSWNAWPRVLALFRLVHAGSHHPSLPVPAYGGELFAPGEPGSTDGVSRSIAVFESACFDGEVLPDRDVHRILERITRTRVKIRQGRTSTWIPAPVDFSDLSSEYIGILYEGLLDFELKTAPPGDPIVFLAVGNQPALPLSRLEAMEDKALTNLLEKMKDTSKSDDEDEAEGEVEEAEDVEEDPNEEADDEADGRGPLEPEVDVDDQRHATRTRAEIWARRAVEAGKLVRKPRGALTPEKRHSHENAVSQKARQLVIRVILPGEWYVVRWGGTRKGSGTFYTRPGLAVPTVQRTLRPLAYSPPVRADGTLDHDAPPSAWLPKAPEEILSLKVLDPACGSGTFPVAALRFLTEALFAALHQHGRIAAEADRAVVHLLRLAPERTGEARNERLGEEHLPCRPDDPLFESRLKAVLRRHIVERSIYGVDLDPLAVELCRLSLWLETMDRSLPFSFIDHKVKLGNGLIGAWFDQFQHYPVMAWKNRDGGDKGHTKGVHFQKEERTKAIKAFAGDILTKDLHGFLAGPNLIDQRDLQREAATVHATALAALSRLHDLPVQDSAERARLYREELLGSTAYRTLRSAMDLWCACWFWPVEEIAHAPRPTTLARPSESTRAIAQRVAASKRFFHWELEFPDVFRQADAGFDAVLGNPPWDIAKPNSKEFFSNIDPLYRAYGKQEALDHQSGYFASIDLERSWLDENSDFRAQSNFVGYAASAYGDPDDGAAGQDRFTIARGKDGVELHTRWRAERKKSRGFADRSHSFRHQGGGDLNLYKLFLEQAHALLRPGGRLGFIVPSGLYSDNGTGNLRRLFLDHCRWEWLFGFENRDKIFEIHRSYKFNATIIEKGGATSEIRTAFMRRKLEDWDHAEEFATPYARAQVEQFSPRSKAILEIQSRRDLEILEKIYSNSVLLGDEGPDGWGITYAREFDMTNDSKLFPPRPKWEADGYRPDEYSRWLKGTWRPIDELWAELRVAPSRPVPLDPTLAERLGGSDVARTSFRVRCAQPPYDRLPVPRADVPAGIILSREADAWIREEEVEDSALPLYEGRMIGQFDFSQKGWVSGKSRTAVWREIPWSAKQIEPQYLMGLTSFMESKKTSLGPKVAYMRISSSTNARTTISTYLRDEPAGDSVFFFLPQRESSYQTALVVSGVLSTFAFDVIIRQRLGGLNMSEFLMVEAPLPRLSTRFACAAVSMLRGIALGDRLFAREWLANFSSDSAMRWREAWSLTPSSRVGRIASFNALVAAWYGLSTAHLADVISGCDFQVGKTSGLNSKGFWRVDKDKDPELRHTVLSLVAFHDLDEKIRVAGGDQEKGIEAFLQQNNGEGWMLPETLRLADYGLGHDERAKQPQPVASCLGPRFYDWQLAQGVEESWRECHLHARNLLGEDGYRKLTEGKTQDSTRPDDAASPAGTTPGRNGEGQGKLFD
jgi:hypothetical protein